MQITISALELWTIIGVPEEERKAKQLILADITLMCDGVTGGNDALKDTVDYEEVVQRVKELAKMERKTLERFAEDIARELLSIPKVKRATVTLKKFALPGTKSISITTTRS